MSCPVAHEGVLSEGSSARKRIQTACEACRVAKIRCLPSDQSGVCQKCLASKKECVSRTGPRKRRPNKSKLPPGDSLPPPPKPTGTFTIDIPLSKLSSSSDNTTLDSLRDTHAAYMESLFPPSSHLPSQSSSTSSPFPFLSTSSEAPSSPSTTTTTTDIHARPTFNIASATSLLSTFRLMLPYCPFILIPSSTTTIRSLAQDRPFLLLAILAAAAGSRTLQGHNLYDEEFRKVFALKLVAGGERTLELLQGLLVYCLWYPFHLRPRVKQVFQYTRMAADLVHDLELDVDARAEMQEPPTPDRLDAMRAYIAQYYLSSCFAVTWQAHRSAPVPFTPWMEHCCGVLARHGEDPGDAVLASLVRLSHTVRDAWAALRDNEGKNAGASAQNSSLVFRGLEAQFREQQAALPPGVSSTLPIRLQALFTEFFLLGGSILRLPTTKAAPLPPPSSSSSGADPLLPNLTRLTGCVVAASQFLALFVPPSPSTPAAVSSAALSHFSSGDWGRLVLAIVVAMRLSFPLPECPEYDSSWARSQLGFGAFLGAMTREAQLDLTEASKRADVASASRIVLAVVKEKYEKRLAALLQEQQGQMHVPQKSGPKCPMLDGSLESYFPLWDGSGAPLSIPPLSFEDGLMMDGDNELLDAWADEAMNWIDPEQDDDTF